MGSEFLLECLILCGLIAAIGLSWRVQVTHLFDPIALYTYLFFLLYVLRGIFLTTGLDVPYPEDLMPADTTNQRIRTLLMSFLWVMGFLFAAAFTSVSHGLSRAFIRPVGGHGYRQGVLHPMAFLIVCLGLFILSLLVAAVPLSRHGFNIAAITHAVRVERIFSGAFFVVNIPAICGYFCSAFTFTALLEKKRGRWHLPSALIWGVFGLGLLAVLITVLFGDRDQIMFYLIFTVLGFSLYVKKLPMLLLGALGGFGVWALSYMQIMRLKLWGYDLIFDSFVRQFSAALNLDFYDKTLLMLYHYPLGGERGGIDYLLGFLGVIPRSLWETKPQFVDPGAWFRSQFFPETTSGWPLTITAEWFLNFSWTGVIFGGLLSGLLYMAIQYRYQDFKGNPLAFMLLFILAVRVFPLGYKATVPMYVILWWIPIVMTLIFLRFFSKRLQ